MFGVLQGYPRGISGERGEPPVPRTVNGTGHTGSVRINHRDRKTYFYYIIIPAGAALTEYIGRAEGALSRPARPA